MNCVFVFVLFALVGFQLCQSASVPEEKKVEVATDLSKIVDPFKDMDPSKVVPAVEEHVEISPDQSHLDATPAKILEEKVKDEKKA